MGGNKLGSRAGPCSLSGVFAESRKMVPYWKSGIKWTPTCWIVSSFTIFLLLFPWNTGSETNNISQEIWGFFSEVTNQTWRRNPYRCQVLEFCPLQWNRWDSWLLRARHARKKELKAKYFGNQRLKQLSVIGRWRWKKFPRRENNEQGKRIFGNRSTHESNP